MKVALKSAADLKLVHAVLVKQEADTQETGERYDHERQADDGFNASVTYDAVLDAVDLRRFNTTIRACEREAIFFRDALLALYPLE